MSKPATVPCKRPKVTVDPHATVAGAFSATCHVPGCSWTYGTRPYQAVKTDAEQQAVRHRAEHRAAVPKTHVNGGSRHGFHASCFDAQGWAHWSTPAGCTTRTDVEASLSAHLSAEHGLVVCA